MILHTCHNFDEFSNANFPPNHATLNPKSTFEYDFSQ